MNMAAESGIDSIGGRDESSFVVGKRASRCSSVAARRSGSDLMESKSRRGGCNDKSLSAFYNYHGTCMVRSDLKSQVLLLGLTLILRLLTTKGTMGGGCWGVMLVWSMA